MAEITRKKFEKGAFLFHEGDAGDCAYLIESGSVEILINRNGQNISVRKSGQGALIGEIAVIDAKPRAFTVQVVEECEAIEISRKDFIRRLEQSDPVVKMIMDVVARRYRDIVGGADRLSMLVGDGVTVPENLQQHFEAVHSLRNLHDLERAFERDEFCVYYQPIVNMRIGNIAGFEALLRWRHPEKGILAPFYFIPLAEESGFIVKLTELVLGRILNDLNHLQDAVPSSFSEVAELFVGVNFSAHDFKKANLLQKLAARFKNTGIYHKQIHIEITENTLMDTGQNVRDELHDLQTAGFNISIDDFGTGYSSLNYLQFFPVNTLKIDKSFVQAMSENYSSIVMVRSLIELAHNLKMEVVAEGVETEEQSDILRNLACDYCQGYFYSRPVPLEKAVNFLKTYHTKSVVKTA